MSYTIVYDRRFLKCGDRYIPMALYGANNVTEINYRTGKEVRCRSWGLFTYSDDMILGTAEKILEIAGQYHPKDSHDGESFKFHGKWMDDAATYRFVENGIREAMSIEDIAWQANAGSIIGEIRVYKADFTYDKSLSTDQAYLHTTEELVGWVENAKRIKRTLLDDGEARSVYICLGYLSSEPLKVTAIKDRTVPHVAVYRGKPYRSQRPVYVEKLDVSKIAYTQESEKALVFPNVEEAYARIPMWAREHIKLVPAATVQKRAERAEAKYVLTAMLNGRRVFIERRTRRNTYYTDVVTGRTKRFRSEAEARKWFAKTLEGKTNFTEPEVVCTKNK